MMPLVQYAGIDRKTESEFFWADEKSPPIIQLGFEN